MPEHYLFRLPETAKANLVCRNNEAVRSDKKGGQS